MKLVIQRVTNASVEVEGEITGQIEEGLMVLVGFGQTDSEKEVEYLARKLCKLRIFPDDEGRMNRSVYLFHNLHYTEKLKRTDLHSIRHWHRMKLPNYLITL